MNQELVDLIITYLVPIGIMLITIMTAYLTNRLLLGVLVRSSADLRNDPTSYQYMRRIIVVLIYLVGIGLSIYSIPSLRALAGSLLAGAGILAVAIGFASQHALGNVISGLFIVIFKPFRIGDRLAIHDHEGIVEDITLRHTIIRNFENKRIIIPNTVISNEVLINSDFASLQIVKWIDIRISYNSDIDLAKSIVAEEIINHPLQVDVRTPEEKADGVPEAQVRVLALQESAVVIRGWAWAKNAPDGFVLQCDLLESIKKRFDAEGIEIPYQQSTVHIKNG